MTQILNLLKSSKAFSKGKSKFLIDSQLEFLIFKGLSTRERIKYWRYKGKTTSRIVKHTYYFQNLVNARSIYEKCIHNDIDRTFPTLQFFQKENEGYRKLFRILKAFSIHCKEIGYCQGMNFLAANLLLNMNNEEETFWMLVSVMEDYGFKKFYKKDLYKLRLAYFQLEYFLEIYLPNLHKYFKDNQLTPDFYSTSWFLTLLCIDLPIDISLKMIDLFLLKKTKILFNFILSFLQLGEEKILQLKYDDALIYVKSFLQKNYIDENKLLQQADSIKITNKMLKDLKILFNALEKNSNPILRTPKTKQQILPPTKLNSDTNQILISKRSHPNITLTTQPQFSSPVTPHALSMEKSKTFSTVQTMKLPSDTNLKSSQLMNLTKTQDNPSEPKNKHDSSQEKATNMLQNEIKFKRLPRLPGKPKASKSKKKYKTKIQKTVIEKDQYFRQVSAIDANVLNSTKNSWKSNSFVKESEHILQQARRKRKNQKNIKVQNMEMLELLANRKPHINSQLFSSTRKVSPNISSKNKKK